MMKVANRTVVVALLISCAMQVPTADAQGGYRIAGRVVSSTSAAPLSQVRVTIANVQNRNETMSVVTGEGGTFVFGNLPAGKYSLSAARHGFIESMYMQHDNYSTAIATGGDTDSEHLVLRLTPQAVLSGRVVDESGDPVRRARVSLFRQDQSTGIGRVRRVAAARTDDRGTFEFAELAAGTYFLSANARPWYALNPRSYGSGGGSAQIQNSDGSWSTVTHESTTVTPAALPVFNLTYPTTYYSDATDSDDATPIPLRGGERLNVDMHLNPVPALRIVFRTGGSERGFAMPQISTRSFDSMDNIMSMYMDRGPGGPEDAPQSIINTLGTGFFELTGIPAGKYMMRVPGIHDSGTPGIQAEIDLSQDGQEITPSAGQPAGIVKFAVNVAGEGRLPQGLMLGLRTAEHRLVRTAPVNAQGECEMEIPPGNYELLAGTPNNDYAVTAMVINGARSRGHSLAVTSGASLDATITLVGGQAVVQGVAKRDGKAAAGAMVVLVPKDPDAHAELFRRDQSDSDGTFSLATVIPGEYTVVAIEDGWGLDWSQPGVILRYMAKGRRVVVSANEREAIHLSEPVEVQSR